MRVICVNAGRPRLLMGGGGAFKSAINKRPVAGPVRATGTGLAGDEQSNTRVHGGPQLAMCVYPHEHYEFFANRLGRTLDVPAFGENLTTEGLDETEVCIGDVYRIGTTIVQISQPREPCVNLARKHEEPRIVEWIMESGYSGFYLRVLEDGELQAGDAIERLERPHGGLSVRAAMLAMFLRDAPRELIEAFTACDALSPKWKARMRKRLDRPEELF